MVDGGRGWSFLNCSYSSVTHFILLSWACLMLIHCSATCIIFPPQKYVSGVVVFIPFVSSNEYYYCQICEDLGLVSALIGNWV